jgi:hypothetical protein
MWTLSFNTIDLAILQENYETLYKGGVIITPEQLSDLKKHVWVILASKLSPSNLVIRHWCLIDLFSGAPDHAEKILKMVDLLSYKKDENGMRIWAEGGYYFWYTMCILQLWLDKFSPFSLDTLEASNISEINRILSTIRKGITETAYLRNGEWYLAPFGDVRNNSMAYTPIGIDLQDIHQQPSVTIAVISRIDSGPITYRIKARPIRFNLHIPKDDYIVSVINGDPVGFVFYDGWDKKYKDKGAEIADMLSFKRLLSFFVI